MNRSGLSTLYLLGQTSRELTYYQNIHRLLLALGGLHILLCAWFAVMTHTWLLVIFIAVPAWLIAWRVTQQDPLALSSRLTMAVVFMIFTGLVIQQSGGDLEGHFSYFVMLSALVGYCDWRPLVLATLTILVHHLSFLILQPLGLGFVVFNDSRSLWGHFFVHVAVGSIQTAVLIYAAHILRELVVASFIVCDATLAIAAGNLDVKINTATVRDSPMLAAVQTMQSQLIAHRDNLNTLVANRTKELEIAKEAAIAASQAKSEFLANMSHEIRTPMNAVLGFSSILNNLITDKTQRYYLDAIERSGKTLLQLINDILDLSKIEAGKFTLQYSPVSLRAVLDDVRIIFSQKAAEKGLDFSISIPEKIPDGLLLDEIRVRQVLVNLLGNAFKFTHAGFVKITVGFSFKIPDKEINVSIHVCDSGIGIPKAQQEEIFSAFTQQVNQSVEYGGTGLGLTICTRLMELMRGHISVESEVGKGSCFTLTLNGIEIADRESIPLESLPCQTLAVKFQPAQILLVDDSEINCLLIKAYLADYPELKVIEAESGEEALVLVHQYRFELIFMDRIMPGEHGDSICQKIRLLPEYADIPIIMISATVTGLHESQEPVFYDVQLNKPVNKAELLAAMQNFLPAETVQPITVEPQIPPVSDTEIENSIPTENLSELLALLASDYQASIAQLNSSKALQIDTLIGIAEQLLQVAERYHCDVLLEWANTLKNQAELFDLENLPATLSGFPELVRNIS